MWMSTFRRAAAGRRRPRPFLHEPATAAAPLAAAMPAAAAAEAAVVVLSAAAASPILSATAVAGVAAPARTASGSRPMLPPLRVSSDAQDCACVASIRRRCSRVSAAAAVAALRTRRCVCGVQQKSQFQTAALLEPPRPRQRSIRLEQQRSGVLTFLHHRPRALLLLQQAPAAREQPGFLQRPAEEPRRRTERKLQQQQQRRQQQRPGSYWHRQVYQEETDVQDRRDFALFLTQQQQQNQRSAVAAPAVAGEMRKMTLRCGTPADFSLLCRHYAAATAASCRPRAASAAAVGRSLDVSTGEANSCSRAAASAAARRSYQTTAAAPSAAPITVCEVRAAEGGSAAPAAACDGGPAAAPSAPPFSAAAAADKFRGSAAASYSAAPSAATSLPCAAAAASFASAARSASLGSASIAADAGASSTSCAGASSPVAAARICTHSAAATSSRSSASAGVKEDTCEIEYVPVVIVGAGLTGLTAAHAVFRSPAGQAAAAEWQARSLGPHAGCLPPPVPPAADPAVWGATGAKGAAAAHLASLASQAAELPARSTRATAAPVAAAVARGAQLPTAAAPRTRAAEVDPTAPSSVEPAAAGWTAAAEDGASATAAERERTAAGLSTGRVREAEEGRTPGGEEAPLVDRRQHAVLAAGGTAAFPGVRAVAHPGAIVLIAESRDRVGGCLYTRKCGDFIVDCGANSFRLTSHAVRLLQQLQLLPRLRLADSKLKRYICWEGRLHESPADSLSSFLSSQLLSLGGKLRLLAGVCGFFPPRCLWRRCSARNEAAAAGEQLPPSRGTSSSWSSSGWGGRGWGSSRSAPNTNSCSSGNCSSGRTSRTSECFVDVTGSVLSCLTNSSRSSSSSGSGTQSAAAEKPEKAPSSRVGSRWMWWRRSKQQERRAADEDENIQAFVARRLGWEMQQRVVDAVVTGVCAGSSSQLSMRAAMGAAYAPLQHGVVIFAFRSLWGSLRRALFDCRLSSQVGSTAPRALAAAGDEATCGATARRKELHVPAAVANFDGGMQVLIDGLMQQLPIVINDHLPQPVDSRLSGSAAAAASSAAAMQSTPEETVRPAAAAAGTGAPSAEHTEALAGRREAATTAGAGRGAAADAATAVEAGSAETAAPKAANPAPETHAIDKPYHAAATAAAHAPCVLRLNWTLQEIQLLPAAHVEHLSSGTALDSNSSSFSCFSSSPSHCRQAVSSEACSPAFSTSEGVQPEAPPEAVDHLAAFPMPTCASAADAGPSSSARLVAFSSAAAGAAALSATPAFPPPAARGSARGPSEACGAAAAAAAAALAVTRNLQPRPRYLLRFTSGNREAATDNSSSSATPAAAAANKQQQTLVSNRGEKARTQRLVVTDNVLLTVPPAAAARALHLVLPSQLRRRLEEVPAASIIIAVLAYNKQRLLQQWIRRGSPRRGAAGSPVFQATTAAQDLRRVVDSPFADGGPESSSSSKLHPTTFVHSSSESVSSSSSSQQWKAFASLSEMQEKRTKMFGYLIPPAEREQQQWHSLGCLLVSDLFEDRLSLRARAAGEHLAAVFLGGVQQGEQLLHRSDKELGSLAAADLQRALQQLYCMRSGSSGECGSSSGAPGTGSDGDAWNSTWLGVASSSSKDSFRSLEEERCSRATAGPEEPIEEIRLVHVQRWPDTIPLCGVGHLQLLQELQQTLHQKLRQHEQEQLLPHPQQQGDAQHVRPTGKQQDDPKRLGELIVEGNWVSEAAVGSRIAAGEKAGRTLAAALQRQGRGGE